MAMKLSVANFDLKHRVNYTYFKGNRQSYIDHCLVSSQLSKCITSCNIRSDMKDCTSDHFPVDITVNVDIEHRKSAETVNRDKHSFSRFNWSNKLVKETYKKNIADLAKNIIPPVVSSSSSLFDIQISLDTYCNDIISVMHSSANNSAVSTTVSCKASRKPKRWWTSQCTSAGNKHRFWLSLWRFSGRPKEGAVCDSYKYSKHLFRKSCILAINNSLNENFRDCDTMLRQRRMGAFWRKIKKSRSNDSDNFKCISINSLENHFRENFAYNFDNETDFVNAARREVNDKMKQCEDSYSNFIFTERMLRKYIPVLKSGCSPGIDGITSEHIKFASNSEIMLHLCNLFSLCFIYGLVPTVFTKGLLVPILKKPTLDPSVAKNYCPVIVSSILSKLIELFIIDECNTVELSDFQFGFVPGRGTNTAISLSHDVASYCNYNSSPVLASPTLFFSERQ